MGDDIYPEEAACIALTILEKILDSSISKVISTTHSSYLKVLSVSDDKFTVASVLIQEGHSTKYNLPKMYIIVVLPGNHMLQVQVQGLHLISRMIY